MLCKKRESKPLKTKTFLIRYINITKKKHVASTSQLAHIYLFNQKRRALTPRENKLVENVSKSIGIQLTNLSKEMPNNVQRYGRGKYVIAPIR